MAQKRREVDLRLLTNEQLIKHLELAILRYRDGIRTADTERKRTIREILKRMQTPIQEIVKAEKRDKTFH